MVSRQISQGKSIFDSPLSFLGRREWLISFGSILAAALSNSKRLLTQELDEPMRMPGKKRLLVHNDYPEDLETPLHYFDSWITPQDVFFVRQHLPRPQVDETSWRLTINGRVAEALSLNLSDLQQFPQVTVAATLECAGNGRGFFNPKVPGIPWTSGAIGNAQWKGIRLNEILRHAGYNTQSTHVEFDGADVGLAKTPDFVRSIPIAKAIHPSTLVALEMNGERLPAIHGFPARLIVPGWDGACWVKWLTRITVRTAPTDGFFMKPAYRFPRHNVVPGNVANPEDLQTIEGMQVKSVITSPQNDQRLAWGESRIRGYAWAAEERIKSVEISTDGGSRWTETQIVSPNQNFAWVLWEASWRPKSPGYTTIMSRATDTGGRVQPIEATWNPSGYVWNAIDRVRVIVEER